MQLNGSQILFECLTLEGVDTIFGYPGGAILPTYDVILEYPHIKHILVRHEQGAAHMADGYARATGRVGVCMATSGPGATNLVTGIATAHMDSVPMVIITGQVRTDVIGSDAFQETDITGITQPITKHNYMVEHVEDLARVIKEAFHIASTGRPGPVLIDIPKDVQLNKTEFSYPETVSIRGYKPTTTGHPSQIKKAAKLINEAQRPLIIAGHGVIISRAYNELRETAERGQIPVTTTLLGISCFPESHILSLRMPGMHGMVWANKALQDTDVLVAVGMRFDDRVTGKLAEFAPRARVIHIDIDPAEIDKNKPAEVPIVGDVRQVLAQLKELMAPVHSHVEWLRTIDEWRRKHPSVLIPPSDGLLGQQVIRDIYDATGGMATIVTDVGQHQMWTAQHYTWNKINSHITSGGLGTMGFALPAAIGVKMGTPNEEVWAIAGDGGIQMNIQELAVAVEHKVNIKIAIVNNGYLGMVRQWQQLFHGRRYSNTPITSPDYVKLADAYGCKAFRATTPEESKVVSRQAATYTDGPVLIDFRVVEEENVYPMVPQGASNSNMLEDERIEAKA